MSGAPIPFGSYELLERIAEGGMAEVWRARSRGVAGFEKTVVIKRVLPSLLARPGFTELLVREAKIAARLSHPNIVQIFDLGEREGGYFIAMEYLEGRDLAAVMGYRGASEPMSLPLRLFIAAEVAKALDYAHRARGEDGRPLSIIHRDVSPQNVLLGFEGEVKVLDFGIARADEQGLGRGEDPNVLRGKFAYMSPEQARGEALDRRSDIFSLGIVLYELIARRRMFRGKSSAEILEAVRAARLPDIRRHVPFPAILPLLQRALAVEPADRFGSAGELHAELTRLLHQMGEPVGGTELAAAMTRMFTRAEKVRPNKLQLDLLLRAHDDATGAPAGRSERRSSAEDVTAAQPIARRSEVETRPTLILAARDREGDERFFHRATLGAGGVVLAAEGPMRLAAFGLSGLERASARAARAGLELRRLCRLEGVARLEPTPPMALLVGEVRVAGTGASAATAATEAEASQLLAGTRADEIRVAPGMEGELRRSFRLERTPEGLLLEGFRTRRDRDAGRLRQRAPLFERKPLLRQLSGLLLDAARGQGSEVHLVGGPGVGKSTVLAEIRLAAAPQDFVFVHGRADQPGGDHRFGALADLLEDISGIEPEDVASQRFEKVERLRVLGLSPDEVRLVGELLGLAYPLPPRRRAGRPRGLELALALRRAIRALARERAVVLAIEDLQWMDDATRQVLPLLLRGLPESGVLVLITRRPGSGGPLSADHTLEIPPLGEAGTARLLAHRLKVRDVGPRLTALVYEATDGVPAWVEQVARQCAPHLVVRGKAAELPEGAPPPLEVPAPLRAVASASTARLRPQDRRLLQVAAAFGDEVPVRWLDAVEGLLGRTGRGSLRRLLSRGLLVVGRADLVEADGAWGGDEEDAALPERVRVPGALFRRALLEELEPDDRARLHGRIVATLERLGEVGSLDDIARVIHHAKLSTAPESAIPWLRRSASLAAAQGERARAATDAAAAMHLSLDSAIHDDASSVLELGLEALDASLAADDWASAADVVERLWPRVEGTRPTERARVELGAAMIAAQTGHPERARDILAELEGLEGLDVSMCAEVTLRGARATLGCGDPEGALRCLERARALVKGERLSTGRLLAEEALVYAWVGDTERANRAVADLMATTVALGGDRLRAAALAAAAAALDAEGARRDAANRYREASRVAHAEGALSEAGRHALLAALASLSVGDQAEARDALAAAREPADPAWRFVSRATRMALDVARGVAEPGGVPEELEVLAHRRPAQAALALEALALGSRFHGDEPVAAQRMRRAVALAERAGWRSFATRVNGPR